MVDLLASLTTGVTSNIQISMTSTNKLLVETETTFSEYSFDFNGFILAGQVTKSFPTHPTKAYLSGNTILTGDKDGSIRAYSLSE